MEVIIERDGRNTNVQSVAIGHLKGTIKIIAKSYSEQKIPSYDREVTGISIVLIN